MSVRQAVLVIASLIAVQLMQVADARSTDDVTASPNSDVITLPAAILQRGRHPTSFEQRKRRYGGSTAASGGGQSSTKTSTSPTSIAPASSHGRLSSKETPAVLPSVNRSSSTKVETVGNTVSPTAAELHISNATTTSSSLSDAEVPNTKSTSALV